MAIGSVGEALSALRLADTSSIETMRRSLSRFGQMTSLVAYGRAPGVLELVDGFKRLRAARDLGWSEVVVEEIAADSAQAKVAMGILNRTSGLHELEEAWLIRSLYREDGLTQPEIAQLLGHHKSWVCRRLALAEGLEDRVEGDVRLGLISASAAIALVRLPRCNQRAAADIVIARGLTCPQVGHLVDRLLACTDEGDRDRLLCEAREAAPALSGARGTRRPRTAVEWALLDIASLRRGGARLQARLLAQPMSAHGERAATLLTHALLELQPVLAGLDRTIERIRRKEAHATLGNP